MLHRIPLKQSGACLCAQGLVSPSWYWAGVRGLRNEPSVGMSLGHGGLGPSGLLAALF